MLFGRFFVLIFPGSLPPSPADSGVSDVDSSSSGGHTSTDELKARLQPSIHSPVGNLFTRHSLSAWQSPAAPVVITGGNHHHPNGATTTTVGAVEAAAAVVEEVVVAEAVVDVYQIIWHNNFINHLHQVSAKKMKYFVFVIMRQ